MSKKRVHEITKELKSHGIELDNKEVIQELAALGYDVKTPSSSLEDDQAAAAVQKIVDKRNPKQAVPTVAAKGFVVRRKAAAVEHPVDDGAQQAAQPPAHPVSEQPAAQAEAPVQQPAEQAEPAPEAVPA